LDHDEELRNLLLSQEHEALREFANHLLRPDTDRTSLLTAHLVVEQLLGAMIRTKLSHPDVWLDEADFRSRVNLARAFGLIGEEELRICRVLNKARNTVAHALEPLPEKWKIELVRLAFGRREKGGDNEPKRSLDEALGQLVVLIAAPYLYASFQSKFQNFRTENELRWRELMVEKLTANPEGAEIANDEAKRGELIREVDLELARELHGRNSPSKPSDPAGEQAT
jgi:hypothetical protein